MSVKVPIYFGSMILSDMKTAYQYEIWLSDMLKYRSKKYQNRHSFLVAMWTIFRDRKSRGLYSAKDFHLVPQDPLVSFGNDEMLEWASGMLSLKRKKLRILELEVYKYLRRKGYYPV